MPFKKGTSGNPAGRPPKAGRAEGQGEAAGIPEDLAGLTTEQKAQAVEATLWRWLRDARADRDRGSLARELTGAMRLIGELRRELKAHADVNILVLQQRVAERDAELEEGRRLWDAEMSAVVGGLAGFPEARRAVISALARVRANIAHVGPGYPALPAPAAEGAEAVPPQGALAEAGPAAAAVPLPTEKREPAAAEERPAPPVPEPPAVDGQGRPLPPGWMVGPQGQRLPPGVAMEPGTPRRRGVGGIGGDRYGDGGPLISQD